MPILLIVVSSGFLLGIAAPVLWRIDRRLAAASFVGLPIALTVVLAVLAADILEGSAVRESSVWVPALGLELAFGLDGLSLLFGLLICGMGALVILYADRYLAGDPDLGRFHGLLLAFMASMLGLVLAESLLLVVVFWGLTGLTSFLLIGYEHDRAGSRRSASQALVVTAAGELAMLAGVVLLGQLAGTFELPSLAGMGDLVRGDPSYALVLVLILAGAFTKSAQFPFHFWLPNAMAAPTPVSAYLHSATMVTAGVYLLARLSPVLGGTALWWALLVGAGTATMAVGGGLSLKERDLKRILAYSTVSALGLMVLLLGLGGALAATAAMAYLLAHALYKGALFLVAGAIDHATGTRDVDQLGGLARLMPLTTLAAGLAALSMSGVAPMLGFAAKELALKSALELPAAGVLIVLLVMGGAAAFVAVSGITGLGPFMGPGPPSDGRNVHEAGWQLWLAPLALGISGVMAGLLPWLGAGPLLGAASGTVIGETVVADIRPWYGIDLALLLSAASLVVGILLFVRRRAMRIALASLDPGHRAGPDRAYVILERSLVAWAGRLTALLQNGRLRLYVLVVVVTLLVLEWPILLMGGGFSLRLGTDVFTWELGVAAAIISGAIVAVRTDSRLGAVTALGVVGYGVATVYLLFGAPDLAMAQVLIETLTLLLFVLVVYHLPRMTRISDRPSRLRDGAIAAAGGALVTVFILAISAVPHDPISGFFSRMSQPLAHGRNVVNVIIVDFRAMDTLAEVAVLVTAGFGVVALLKLRHRSDGSP